jgi:hypothetical protein
VDELDRLEADLEAARRAVIEHLHSGVAASRDDAEIEKHLRGASDAVMVLQAEIGQLERHKRGIEPTDRRFAELAAAIRAAAQALLEFSEGEEEWAHAAELTAARTLRTISESAGEPSLAEILERWRAVERALEAAEPGSAEAAELLNEFQLLRSEYLAAFRAHQD